MAFPLLDGIPARCTNSCTRGTARRGTLDANVDVAGSVAVLVGCAGAGARRAPFGGRAAALFLLAALLLAARPVALARDALEALDGRAAGARRHRGRPWGDGMDRIHGRSA